MIVRLTLILWLVFLVPQSLAQSDRDEVESILDSSLKSSEKPMIDQNVCYSKCQETGSLTSNDECSVDPNVGSLENRVAMTLKDDLVLISGKVFDLVKTASNGKVFIVSKKTHKRYFEVLKGANRADPFDGPLGSGVMDENRAFVKKYRYLKRIYLDIRFKELCQYLGANKSRYERLKRLTKE